MKHRFEPPPLPAEPALLWVLMRAFGPRHAPAPAVPGPGAAQLALKLDLAGRIVTRCSRELLIAELGAGATALIAHHELLCALDGLWLRTLAALSHASHTTATPIFLLKFAALRLSCAIGPGERGASDLDILVSRAHQATLIRELTHMGYHPSPSPAYEHQLAPLISPDGVSVEIHHTLPGVCAPGTRKWVTADLLLERGAISPLAQQQPLILAPALPITGAHLLAHGLLQSGPTPEVYPALRLLGDLLALEQLSAGTGESSMAWLAPVVPKEWAEAALKLAQCLAAGTMPQGDGAEMLMLRHLVGGKLEPDYAHQLKLWRWVYPLSEHPRARARFTLLWRAFFPPIAELAQIYGPATPPLRSLQRLTRPLDVLRRAVRILVARRRAKH